MGTLKPKGLVGVVAGNYGEYWRYVEGLNVHYVNRTSGKVICKDGFQHFYVSNPSLMKGIRVTKLVKFGSWARRDDVERIDAIFNAQPKLHA